jgi:hypothetical protein
MNYLHIASLLGHDHARLAQGEEVVTYRLLNDEESCTLISRATPEERLRRRETFFHPGMATRSRLPQGYHDRAEAHVFAAWPLTQTDLDFIHKQMPLPVRMVSVRQKIVRAGERWDLSVRPAHWGKSSKQDCFVVANIGELRLEPGARVVVEGNILSFHCERLLSDGGILEILPTPFSDDDNGGPFDGVAGEPGRAGQPGEHGQPVPVTNSFLGPVLREDFEPAGTHGQRGASGGHGADGGHGRGGGMCKTAEITLLNLEGHLTLMAQAGAGGNGGSGGDGGNGGAGGGGAAGLFTVGTDVRGGDGGDGGGGGSGGRGGKGGNGGLSSNIYISLPPEDIPSLRCIAIASPGGVGGAAGGVGAAGKGGCAAPASHPALAGQDGASASPGAPGKSGRDGRSRPSPWIFINNQMLSGQMSSGQTSDARGSLTPESTPLDSGSNPFANPQHEPEQGEQPWTSLSAQQSLATPASV